jgi:tetratricopeptide (TPR) repeat protein
MSDRLAIPAPRLPDPPDELDPRTSRAEALRAAGDHAAARTLLLGVLIDRPDSVVALRQLCLSHAQTGDFATSVQFAEAGLRVRPDAAVLHRLRAVALTALQRPEEARAAAELGVAYEPRTTVGYLVLVDVLLAVGTVESRTAALAVAIRAGEVADLDHTARLRLAVARGAALRDLDLLAEARAEFTSVLEAEPGHEGALSHVAKAEQESWHVAATARHVGAMLAARPGDAALRRRLRALARYWTGGVVLGAGLALTAAATIRYLAGPAGFLVALAAVAGFAWTVAGSARRVGTRLPTLLRAAAADPVSLVAAAVATVLTTGALVVAVDPDAVERAPYWDVLIIGGFLAVNAIMFSLQLAAAAAARTRRRRLHLAGAGGRAATGLRPVDPYPVETPVAGALLLALTPATVTAARRGVEELAAAGVGTIVSTSRPAVDARLGLGGLTAAAGVELVSFPVEPGRPPAEPEVDLLVDAVAQRVRGGGVVAFACVTGAERSALLAAAVLVGLGLDPGSAWARVTAARGAPLGVSAAQRAWLDGFAARERSGPAPGATAGPDAR